MRPMLWKFQALVLTSCALVLCLLAKTAEASYGDRLPEFKECIESNCQAETSAIRETLDPANVEQINEA